jgi:hypothetical protein
MNGQNPPSWRLLPCLHGYIGELTPYDQIPRLRRELQKRVPHVKGQRICETREQVNPSQTPSTCSCIWHNQRTHPREIKEKGGWRHSFDFNIEKGHSFDFNIEKVAFQVDRDC